MSHPYPERTGHAVIMLSLAEPPSEPYLAARAEQAQVLMSDQSSQPVTVLAWHQLNKPIVQTLTNYQISWLVQLRLSDGSEAWYQYVAANLRHSGADANLQP